jgi:hypothetical protein
MFGNNGEEVIGGLTKLHFEKIHGFYSSPNIIGAMKLRGLRLVGNMTLMRKNKIFLHSFVPET